ncbi:DUF3850 domain-containing protein [Listeria seeligeri]|uniref:DUF3850 domain-containing protein n=1 Tax=Listeria seeligeri TaxID=1640 RepID=UPI00162A8ADA|nr:DUF3850 domain-containing protein [Listeria seeligeri]MBC2248311.1 DUF3850 domain-containing protein [Listeria seeligeri]
MPLWELDGTEDCKKVICHCLKTKPMYFEQLLLGYKTHEIRKNDRNFQVGDKLDLKEWDAGYTGRKLVFIITHITNYKQKNGFVVLSIQKQPSNIFI